MSNTIAKIEKVNGIDMLTVSLPVNVRASKTGKTTVIASTNGNHATTCVHDGKPIILGLNAYVK